MILNDKPNYQVSRILMYPRPIFSDRSENDPVETSYINAQIKVLYHIRTSLTNLVDWSF
jgi:hypothetical protein